MLFDEYVEILRLFDEDPQQLIDKKTELEFNEVEGKAIMFDGVAAGTAFEGFQFISGPHAGKKLFCQVDYHDGKTCGWAYSVNVNSDGFLFNWDPSIDVSKIGDGETTGGDFLPELNGLYLTLSGANGGGFEKYSIKGETKMQKTIATGYELELVNVLLEKVGQLYEFPDAVKSALAMTSNVIQEQAVSLDMIDSLQTSCGPLRRSFTEQDLVIMHSLVVDALSELAKIEPVAMPTARKNLLELRKMMEHPDQTPEAEKEKA